MPRSVGELYASFDGDSLPDGWEFSGGTVTPYWGDPEYVSLAPPASGTWKIRPSPDEEFRFPVGASITFRVNMSTPQGPFGVGLSVVGDDDFDLYIGHNPGSGLKYITCTGQPDPIELTDWEDEGEPTWFRVRRESDAEWTGWSSVDGDTWVEQGRAELEYDADWPWKYIELWVTAHGPPPFNPWVPGEAGFFYFIEGYAPPPGEEEEDWDWPESDLPEVVDNFTPGAMAPAVPTAQCMTVLDLIREFSATVKRAVRLIGTNKIEMVDPNDPLPTGWFSGEGDEIYHSTHHGLTADVNDLATLSGDLAAEASAALVTDDVRLVTSDWQIPNRLPVYGLDPAPVKRVSYTFTPKRFTGSVEFHVPTVPIELRRT